MYRAAHTNDFFFKYYFDIYIFLIHIIKSLVVL